jgi:hypothetical protein
MLRPKNRVGQSPLGLSRSARRPGYRLTWIMPVWDKIRQIKGIVLSLTYPQGQGQWDRLLGDRVRAPRTSWHQTEM